MRNSDVYKVLKGTCCLLLCFSILTSCQKKSSYGITIDEEKLEQKAHLFNDDTKPFCSLQMEISYIDNATKGLKKDTLNRLILAEVLGNEYTRLDIKDALKKYADNYCKSYQNDMESVYTDESKEENDSLLNTSGWFAYEEQLQTSVIRNDDHFLVYKIERYDYTGGAHGLGTENYLNIDLRTNKILSLYDIINPEEKETISNLLWKQLSIDQKSSRDELEDQGYGMTGDLNPSETFYISENSVTFVYNPYDIAPYALGIISITLPMSELKPYLIYNL